MTPRQLPWKWLLFGLLAVLLLCISLIPWLIGDTSRFGERVASELSAWTGGELKFTGPVKVSFLPDVSVRGQIELTDSARLPMVQTLTAREAKVSLDLVDLLRGRITIDALRLLKPRIALKESANATAKLPPALFANLLSGAPMRVLHVRKGRIKLARGSIRDIFGHFDASETGGAVSGFGSFIYNNATVRYSVETGAPVTVAEVETVPVSLTLTSKPLRAKMTGTASLAGSLKLDGDMLAEIDDLRRFVNWAGVNLPAGESLKALTVAGGFHLCDGTLAFDDGTFVLDGNKAVGLLAVTSAPLRPRIEGTLAFDRLALDPYLGIGQRTDAPKPIAQISPFDRALPNYFDADLRISAAEITAGALKLGHGAFTITAKDGSVTSEIGELELCGGSADGRVGIELTPATKQVRLAANLTDIAFPSCLTALGLDVPLTGTGGIKADLASEGNGYPELTRNLSGMLQAKLRSGTVPVDFVRLLAASPPLDANGWNRDGPTAYDQLGADCRLNAGHLWCQSLKIETPRGTLVGAGEVDLPNQTLDWNLVVKPASAVNAAQPAQAEPKVSIRGPLSQPTIRRADRPTLGDGSQPASPAKPQDVPN